jgi:hypothetical protein
MGPSGQGLPARPLASEFCRKAAVFRCRVTIILLKSAFCFYEEQLLTNAPI